MMIIIVTIIIIIIIIMIILIIIIRRPSGRACRTLFFSSFPSVFQTRNSNFPNLQAPGGRFTSPPPPSWLPARRVPFGLGLQFSRSEISQKIEWFPSRPKCVQNRYLSFHWLPKIDLLIILASISASVWHHYFIKI